MWIFSVFAVVALSFAEPDSTTHHRFADLTHPFNTEYTHGIPIAESTSNQRVLHKPNNECDNIEDGKELMEHAFKNMNRESGTCTDNLTSCQKKNSELEATIVILRRQVADLTKANTPYSEDPAKETPNREETQIEATSIDDRLPLLKHISTVSSQDPQVLNFQEGERLFIYNDYGDGTFLGRRMNMLGVSGIVSRSDVIPESSLPSQGVVQNPEPLDETGKPITLSSQSAVDEAVENTALEAQPWYFGPKERPQANEMLMGKPDGTFIVRLSVRENKNILSVAFGGLGKHMKIEMAMEPTGIKYYLHDGRLFDSVFDLIAYHRENTLAEGFEKINTVLTRTLLKTKTYRVLQDYKHPRADAAKYLELRRNDIVEDLIAYHRENTLAEGFEKINTVLTRTLLKTKTYRVLQDYKHPRVDAAKYRELRRNDIVEVIDTRGEEMGWWRFQDGARSGFFPITYVKAVPAENVENEGSEGVTAA
uniref:SH2 domain-containing protein n=1 Tax=Panagrellus redivivus TaxID=6233 RepID=A0A7E4VTD4_PANRE